MEKNAIFIFLYQLLELEESATYLEIQNAIHIIMKDSNDPKFDIIRKFLSSDKNKAKLSQLLNQRIINETTTQIEGTSPFVRTSETIKLIDSLSNGNPILIVGENLAGKTSLPANLASLIANSDDTPKWKIYSLNNEILLSDNNKLEDILAAFRQNPNLVLFIDDIEFLIDSNNPKFMESIKKYLADGGKLIVSALQKTYEEELKPLGIEKCFDVIEVTHLNKGQRYIILKDYLEKKAKENNLFINIIEEILNKLLKYILTNTINPLELSVIDEAINIALQKNKKFIEADDFIRVINNDTYFKGRPENERADLCLETTIWPGNKGRRSIS